MSFDTHISTFQLFIGYGGNMLNLASLFEKDPQKLAFSKAMRAWSKLHWQVPPINYLFYREYFNRENPQICVSNWRPSKFSLGTISNEAGACPVQDSVLIFLSYSPLKKGNGWVEKEMIEISRDSRLNGLAVEVTITFVKGEQPKMWISSSDKTGGGGGSLFEGKDFTFEEVLRRYPEFVGYVPSRGAIDIEKTAESLSSLTNDVPLPFVMKK